MTYTPNRRWCDRTLILTYGQITKFWLIWMITDLLLDFIKYARYRS